MSPKRISGAELRFVLIIRAIGTLSGDELTENKFFSYWKFSLKYWLQHLFLNLDMIKNDIFLTMFTIQGPLLARNTEKITIDKEMALKFHFFNKNKNYRI